MTTVTLILAIVGGSVLGLELVAFSAQLLYYEDHKTLRLIGTVSCLGGGILIGLGLWLTTTTPRRPQPAEAPCCRVCPVEEP